MREKFREVKVLKSIKENKKKESYEYKAIELNLRGKKFSKRLKPVLACMSNCKGLWSFLRKNLLMFSTRGVMSYTT